MQEPFGLLRPFRRDQKADFAAGGAAQLIRSAVGQILGTIGASDTTPGELPWRTEFGSLLHRLRHQKNDSLLQELARVYVVEALKRWEPRIVVTAVTIGREQHDGENVLAAPLRRHLDKHARRQRYLVRYQADSTSARRLMIRSAPVPSATRVTMPGVLWMGYGDLMNVRNRAPGHAHRQRG